MTIKTALAVIALALSPTLALAEGGCSHGKTDVQASSCMEGTMYDTAKGACVPVINS
jgi:hypothetical protein